MTADGATVDYQVDGHIAWITLRRPEAMNAINTQMRSELPAAIAAAEQDEQVRVLVLQGAGDRAFSAGADITEFVAPESLVSVRQTKQPPTWIDAIGNAIKPVLASIRGYCLGGGLEIALACDIRIAASDAVFGLPEVTRGIIPGAGGTQRLPRVIGVARALELILTGERFSAERALEIGLVSSVVAPEDLLATTKDWADKLLRGAPRAVAFAKEAILRGSEVSLIDGLRLEADLSTLLQSTEDRLEGAAAFRERRNPNYRGV